MKRSLLGSFIIIISALLSINILINICSKKDTTEETLFYTKNHPLEFHFQEHKLNSLKINNEKKCRFMVNFNSCWHNLSLSYFFKERNFPNRDERKRNKICG